MTSRHPLRRRITATLAAATTLAALSACGSGTSPDINTTTVAATVVSTAETHADSNDGEYDATEATTIALADGATAVEGDGSDDVSVDGDVVTISAAGTYLLSGALTDGQVVVDSTGEGKVKLVLDGVDITSSSTSPVVITEADEAVVILADGTSNTLADSADSAADDETDDAPNATLYSMADLTIAGTGSLSVDGLSNDGIASKDGLVILSGTLAVTAVDDGIRGKDYAVLEGGTVTIKAGGDGIKADNDSTETSSGKEKALGWFQLDGGEVRIDAGDDGVDALGALNVTDGDLTVSASTEGLEAAQITLAGGTVGVTATDDGLNATAGDGGEEIQEGVVLTLSGSDVHVTSGSDGLDSNGTAILTGGAVVVESGARGGGDGSIDVNGDFVVTGGTLVATGGLSSAPSADSGQGWVAVAVDSPVAAGQQVTLTDDDGEVVARYVVSQATSGLVVSAAGMTPGATYDVHTGDAGDATGFSTGGSADGLTTLSSVTANAYEGGRGPAGGGPGGGGRGEPPAGAPQGGGAPPQQ